SGGIPDSYVIIHAGVNDNVATDEEACVIKPDWNAAVCTGDIGRLTFGGIGGGGFRGFGAGPGPGAAPGAAGGPGGPGAAPAGAGAVRPAAFPAGGARPAAQPPVILSRKGRDYTVTSGTNVRAGTEIRVTTERPTLNLTLSEMDLGSWVIFELPDFTTAASGEAVDSLDALRSASVTSYYKGEDALWVKLVSNG